MKYIYGILCHQMTNPLRFLITSLCKNTDLRILIHVDQKSDLNQFLDEFSNYSQVDFIQNRINVLWGSYSQIEAALELLKTAQAYDYEYFSLLSGDDIPLQKISNFHLFLEKNPHEFLDLDRYPKCKLEPRVKYKHDDCFFNKNRTSKERLKCKWQRKLFKMGLRKNDISHLPKLYKGSQWFTLSHNAINYIFEYLTSHPEYVVPFKTSLCGDELFFHTILLNSNLSNKIKSKNNMSESFIRYIDWETGPDFPRTLNESDFDKMKSSGMFFARKLKYNIALESLKENFDN
ncbi:beta-1,6-N-acetylglucosaminyltransferase [Acinetobacter nematophilus]|uniref:beta-1,6-N-acetylglucosaminyltransferase n=1 Tax=Acinetobacter nematophilus TaxID=2994642 RepID=UPI003AF906CE